MEIARYNLPLARGWKFHLGDIKRYVDDENFAYVMSKAGGGLGFLDVIKEQNYWDEVRVPHDWLTSLPYDADARAAHGFKPRGEGSA